MDSGTAASAMRSDPGQDQGRDEVQKLRDELARVERNTVKLLDGAVHDLRAAERGIKTSAEIIRENLGDSESGAVQRLMDSTARMNLILNGITSYALSMNAGRRMGRV